MQLVEDRLETYIIMHGFNQTTYFKCYQQYCMCYYFANSNEIFLSFSLKLSERHNIDVLRYCEDRIIYRIRD